MSSQIDECLRLLKTNRDQVITELNTYKTNQLAAVSAAAQLKSSTKPSESSQEPGVPSTSTSSTQPELKSESTSTNKPPVVDETRSEISSCLDSNYESDNNSAIALTGGVENRDTQAAERFGLIETKSNTTKSLLLPNSSDESDATLNEAKVNRLLTGLKLGLTELDLNKSTKKPASVLSTSKSKSASSASSSNSDTNTIAPGSPKTPTPLTVELMQDLSNVVENDDLKGVATATAAETDDSSNQAESNVRLKIARQLSDGYSSSCTPLSASSINNEQPTANPFFSGHG